MNPTPTPKPEPSDYGEPWHRGESDTVEISLLDAHDRGIGRIMRAGVRLLPGDYPAEDDYFDRIVTCVNALAGIPNEAVERLGNVVRACELLRGASALPELLMKPDFIQEYLRLALGVDVEVKFKEKP